MAGEQSASLPWSPEELVIDGDRPTEQTRALLDQSVIMNWWEFPADLTHLQALTIQHLPRLRTLDLVDCPALRSLSLFDLPELGALDLQACFHLETFQVSGVPQLTHLDLTGARLETVTPLGALTGLTQLCLNECRQVRDLAPLAELKRLTRVLLADCDQVTSLAPLCALPRLSTLALSGLSLEMLAVPEASPMTTLLLDRCSDLERLPPLGKLTSLSLEDSEQISDLTPLARVPQVRSLSLKLCRQLRDLTPLTTLSHLTALYLVGCRELRDLSPLERLPELTTLNVAYCPHLPDGCLANFHALKKVVISREDADRLGVPATVTDLEYWQDRSQRYRDEQQA